VFLALCGVGVGLSGLRDGWAARVIGQRALRGDDAVLTERDGPQPIFMSDLCRAWEQAAQAATVHGVGAACMRFGLVLGGQGALPMMLLPIKLGLGGPLGGGAQWLSWIHVDDVVGGMAHLCRGGAAGSYNFTAPESLTQAQFNRVAASVLRRAYGFRRRAGRCAWRWANRPTCCSKASAWRRSG
jgi:NAD dependent epimerase/dehydratase family enzyme